MEFLLDSVDLNDVREALAHFPISGITSNPSIVKKSHPADFWSHMKEIRKLIGTERTLHVQVTSGSAEGMYEEAMEIVRQLGKETYVKVPVSFEGLPVIERLAKEGFHVTATAIYDPMQAYLAYCAEAEYMAPYFNRISVSGGQPEVLIEELTKRIEKEKSNYKILAASFKSIGQVRQAIISGAQAVTVPYEILKQVFANPNIEQALDAFEADWISVYGQQSLKNSKIEEIKKRGRPWSN